MAVLGATPISAVPIATDIKIKGVIKEITLRGDMDTKGLIVKASFVTQNDIVLTDKSFGDRDFGIPVTEDIATAISSLKTLLWAEIVRQMGG